MKTLLVLLGWVACAAAGSKAPQSPGKTVEIDGKRFVLGATFQTKPLVEVSVLRAYTASTEDTGADRCIIMGIVLNKGSRDDLVVNIEIDLWRCVNQWYGLLGTLKATVDSPGVGKPCYFQAVGPAPFQRQPKEPTALSCYSLRYSVELKKQ